MLISQINAQSSSCHLSSHGCCRSSSFSGSYVGRETLCGVLGLCGSRLFVESQDVVVCFYMESCLWSVLRRFLIYKETRVFPLFLVFTFIFNLEELITTLPHFIFLERFGSLPLILFHFFLTRFNISTFLLHSVLDTLGSY